MNNILLGVGLLISGLVLGYLVRHFLSAKVANSLEQKSKKIILEAQEKAVSFLEEAKKEDRDRKSKLEQVEERLVKKEESLDYRVRELEKSESHIKQEYSGIEKIKKDPAEVQKKAVTQLEKITGLSA